MCHVTPSVFICVALPGVLVTENNVLLLFPTRWSHMPVSLFQGVATDSALLPWRPLVFQPALIGQETRGRDWR